MISWYLRFCLRLLGQCPAHQALYIKPVQAQPAAIASMKALVPDLAMVPKLLISSSARDATASQLKHSKTHRNGTSQTGKWSMHVDNASILKNTRSAQFHPRRARKHHLARQGSFLVMPIPESCEAIQPQEATSRSEQVRWFFLEIGQGSIRLWPTVGWLLVFIPFVFVPFWKISRHSRMTLLWLLAKHIVLQQFYNFLWYLCLMYSKSWYIFLSDMHSGVQFGLVTVSTWLYNIATVNLTLSQAFHLTNSATPDLANILASRWGSTEEADRRKYKNLETVI